MPNATDTVQEIVELRALLAEREAELAVARAELSGARLRIEQYKAQLAKLRRMQFGRSSEKLDAQIAQLELMLEDLEEGEAAQTAPAAARGRDPAASRTASAGTPAAARSSAARGGRAPSGFGVPELRRHALLQAGRGRDRGLGEDSGPPQGHPPCPAEAELPLRARRSLQAPAPELPIEKGRPGPGLIANVVVGKYLDGLPLYRQSAILPREGIEIERATLADWVGHVAWWVAPLAALIGSQVMAAPIIHTDDTPIAVLAPGNGKTRTGRLWTYVVDERPWQGGRSPAAYYRFSPDRRGERPRDHLAGFRGVIQADAFSRLRSLGTIGGIRPRTDWPRAAAARPCGLLGPCQAQVLRRVRSDQVADRRGGAATDRRALCDRGRDRRPSGRHAPSRAAELAPCRSSMP